jgi:hypothetical protein
MGVLFSRLAAREIHNIFGERKIFCTLMGVLSDEDVRGPLAGSQEESSLDM